VTPLPATLRKVPRRAGDQYGFDPATEEVPDPTTVRALFPSLSPVGQVDCVTVRAPWLDPGGDGWTAARRGRVVALVGSNLMKFAPLLGDRLAQAALSDELPSDLSRSVGIPEALSGVSP
jgi:hypothetical protein